MARRDDSAIWQAIYAIQKRLGMSDSAQVRRGVDALTAAASVSTTNVVTVASMLSDARTNGKAWQVAVFRKAVIAGGYVKLYIANPATAAGATPVRVIVSSASLLSGTSAVANMAVYEGTVANPITVATVPTTDLSTNGAVSNLNSKYATSTPHFSVKFDSKTILGLNSFGGGVQIANDAVLTNSALIDASTAIELAPGTALAIQWGGGLALDFSAKFILFEV